MEGSLRERQQRLTRELILRSVTDLLEHGDPPDITVPAVAEAAGVSVRTVYRHFPTREELIAAATEWIFDELLVSVPHVTRTLDEVLAQTVIFESYDDHPGLARALALTRAGNTVRSARREQRLKGTRTALREVTENLPEDERRRAEAVFGYLANTLAWVTMRDENGLDGAEARKAVDWAMRTLIDDLRRRNDEAGAGRHRQP